MTTEKTPDLGNIFFPKQQQPERKLPPRPPGLRQSTPSRPPGLRPPGLRPNETPVQTPAQQRLKKLRDAQPDVPDPFEDPFFTASEAPVPEQPPGEYGALPPVGWDSLKPWNFDFGWAKETAQERIPRFIDYSVQQFPLNMIAGISDDPKAQALETQKAWYALSPEQRKQIFVDSVTGTEALNVLEDDYVDPRIPQEYVPDDFNSVFTRKFMGGVDVGSRPLDAFGEALWQSVWHEGSGPGGIVPNPALAELVGDLFSDPAKLIDEEYKYIQMFRERPVIQQLAVGLLDPTIVLGAAAKGSRLALMLTRTEAFAARAAQKAGGKSLATMMFRDELAAGTSIIGPRPSLNQLLGGAERAPRSELPFPHGPTMEEVLEGAPVAPSSDIPWEAWVRQEQPTFPAAETWAFDEGRLVGDVTRYGTRNEQYAAEVASRRKPTRLAPNDLMEEAALEVERLQVLLATKIDELAKIKNPAASIAGHQANIANLQRDITATQAKTGKRWRPNRKAATIAKIENKIKEAEKKIRSLKSRGRPASFNKLQKEIDKLQNDIAAINRPMKASERISPLDPSYREVSGPMPTGSRGQQIEEIIVVSAEHPNGRRIGLTKNSKVSNLLQELGLFSNGHYEILSGSATREQVSNVAARLSYRWGDEGLNLPGNASRELDIGRFGNDLEYERPAFADSMGRLELDIGHRRIVNDYLDSIPTETKWVDEAGRPRPTSRYVSGDVEATWMPPPPGAPHVFGGYDIFVISERVGSGTEQIAIVELIKPMGRETTAEIAHFYPVADGIGPGSLGVKGVQQVMNDISKVYPDLLDVMVKGRSRLFGEKKDRFARSADHLDPDDTPLGEVAAISDDVASDINMEVPSSTLADIPAEFLSAVDDAAISKAAKDMEAPIDYGVSARDNPRNMDDTYYEQSDYGTHDRLFRLNRHALRNHMRGLPGMAKAALGVVSRVALEADNKLAMIGHRLELHKEVEKARAARAAMKWWDESQEIFGWKETGVTGRQRLLGQRGVWRATKIQKGYDARVDDRWHATIDDILDDLDREANALVEGKEYTRKFELSPLQESNIRRGQNMMEGTAIDAQNAGVDFALIEREYWHRIMYGKTIKESDVSDIIQDVVGDAAKMLERQAISGRRGFTKERDIIEIEDAIVAKGYHYETNPYLRLAARLESGIEASSNQRALNEVWSLTDVDAGIGSTGKRLFKGEMSQSITDEPVLMEAIKDTERRFKSASVAYKDMYKAVYKEGSTAKYDPDIELAFRRSIADMLTATWMKRKAGERAVAKQIFAGDHSAHDVRQYFNNSKAASEVGREIRNKINVPSLKNRTAPANRGVEAARQSAQLARSIITNFDLAGQFINGQFLIFHKPLIWFKAVTISLEAFMHTPYRYVSKNFDEMDEGMLTGAISRPTEYMFERTGLASIPTRIPLFGNVATRFNRVFEWMVIAGQTEMYKAARVKIASPDNVPFGKVEKLQQEQMDALIGLGSAVRKTLGTDSYAILGIRADQQTLEAFALFAPRFFRANIGLMVEAFGRRGGVAKLTDVEQAAAYTAQNVLAKSIAGGVVLTTALHYGITGRMPNVTDPYAPDWMQVPVGSQYMNVYGPFYGYLRTLARVAYDTQNGDLDKAARTIKTFMTGRASIPFRAVGLGGHQLFGQGAKTFEGEDIFAGGLKGTPGSLYRLGEETMLPMAPTEVAKGLSEGRYESVTEFIGLQGRSTPYQQLDIMYQQYMSDPINEMVMMHEETGISPRKGVTQVSFRDAPQFDHNWMNTRHGELYNDMKSQASGHFGEASSKIWDNHKAAIASEKVLNDKLFNPKYANMKEAVDGEAYRATFDEIQRTKWDANQQVWKDADLFQDEIDPTEEKDPNRRAMLQYREVFQSYTDLDGRMNWDEIQADLKILEEDEWSPEQLQYVSANTSLWHTEQGEELVRDRRALKEYWGLRDKFSLEFSDNPNRQKKWKNLYDTYFRSPASIRSQLRQMKSYRTMLKIITNKTKSWVKDNDDHGEEIEVLLVKWGYEVDPMTPKAIAKLEEQNALLSDVQLPSLRPTLSMPDMTGAMSGMTGTPRTSSPAPSSDNVSQLLAGMSSR